MRVNEVTKILEDFAPLSFQESYDNAGLIVGDSSSEVTGILICLDVTEGVITEAKECGCNLIVSHHPIIFQGLKRINGKNQMERTVISAIRDNISIYTTHTNLDNVMHGVSFKVAEVLGVKNCRILQPKKQGLSKVVTYAPKENAEQVRQAMFRAGGGHIGNYEECSFNSEGYGTYKGMDGATPYLGKIGETHTEREVKIESVVPNYKISQVVSAINDVHPYEEVAYDVYKLDNQNSSFGSGVVGELLESEKTEQFLRRLKASVKTDCIRHTQLVVPEIRRVAICGGSGSFLLEHAKNAGADIFITADFKYHQFFDADDKIIIADVGHYESEQFTKELIYSILIEKIPNFAVRLSEINTNPINYL